MFWELLAVQLSSTLCGVGDEPLPVRDCPVGEFEALLVNVRFPFTVALAMGVNLTVNPTLPPEGMVIGNDRPLNTNCELSELAAVIVTLAPEACTDAGKVALLP